MVGEPGPKPSAKESRPVKVRQTKATKPTQEQAISLESFIEPRGSLSNKYCPDSLAKVSSEVPPAVDRKSPSTPSVASLHAITQRTLSGNSPRSAATTPKAAIKYNANKPRHVALGKDFSARRTGAPAVTTVALARSAAPAKAPPPTPQTGSPMHKDAFVPKSNSAPVASPQAPIGPFVLSSGKAVVFTQQAAFWKAAVKESWGSFSREEVLPAICQGDMTVILHTLEGQESVHTQKRIHILETHQAPWAPRVVYVGYLGLEGGMPAPDYYVSVAGNSDSDDDQAVHGQTTGGIRVTFRPASNGNWHASTSWHPASRRIWVMSDYRLTLSANDIRAARLTLWYNRVFCTDHVEIHSTPSTISSCRKERRARRYERRQERIRREQRWEQECRDALRRAEEARVRARLEAIRREEVQIAHELVLTEQEEQSFRETMASRREVLYTRQRALHQKRDRLGREAIENERSYQRDMEALERHTRAAEEALSQQRVIDTERDRQRQARAEASVKIKKGFWGNLWSDVKTVSRGVWAGTKAVARTTWQSVKTASKVVWEGTKTVGKFLWKHKWKILTVAVVVAGVVLVVGATGGAGALFSGALPGMLFGTHGGAAAAGSWCFTLGMSNVIHQGIDFLNDYFDRPSVPASDQEVEPLLASNEASSQEQEVPVPDHSSYGTAAHQAPNTERESARVTTTPQVPSEGASNVTQATEQEQNTQEPSPNEASTPWHPPFVARAAPTPDLADLLQQNMQLNEQEEGEEEDRKMPSLPRVTTFTTPAAAQEAVEAFLARWRLETPSGRAAIKDQGKEILKGVATLEKMTASYPLVWNKVLQEQEATKKQLNRLIGLRSQLLDAFQQEECRRREAEAREIPATPAASTAASASEAPSTAQVPAVAPASSTCAASPAQAPAAREQAAEASSAVNNEPKDVHELEASQAIIQFIGRFEGFRANMYKVGGVGRWTIGYGHEFDDEEIPRYEAGITKVQAQELLHQDVQEAIRKIRRYVTAPLTQYQFDALVSYVYNTGSLYETHLLRNINRNNFEVAAREMDIVVQTNPQTGEREVLPGLVRRRAQEQKLFLEGDYGN